MPDQFTKQWKYLEPIWATVIRCPRCNALVDDDWSGCRQCGLEIRHETLGIGKIRVLARDPAYSPLSENHPIYTGDENKSNQSRSCDENQGDYQET